LKIQRLSGKSPIKGKTKKSWYSNTNGEKAIAGNRATGRISRLSGLKILKPEPKGTNKR